MRVPVTRLFYLTVASLTLWAAAAQWLPREGLPTQLSFGPDEARAQSPASPLFPQNAAAPTNGEPTPGGVSNGAFSPSPFVGSGQPPGPVVPSTGTPSTSTTQQFSSQPPLSTVGPISWQPAVQELEGAKVVARVGGEIILAGEVTASINSYLIRTKQDRNSPEVQAQLDELMKMRTMQLVETRIIVAEAKRKIPEEGYNNAMQKFDEEFYNSVVPQMLKERKLGSAQELDALLRKEGTTLEREKRSFAEQVLQNSWLSQSVKVEQEVTHADMLRYYQEHSKEYEFEAKARWEQISIRFDRHPTKAEAYAAIAAAGNQVLDGRPFFEVAKQVSHGSTAEEGGAVKWTTKGSLVSHVLDQALFTLPVGTLSPILEDERGFHIIRVVERVEAGRKPFTETQTEIRKKITEQRKEAARVKYLAEIRKHATVWTIYDKPQVETAAGSAGGSLR
ncbi:MAG: hypothetical protein C0483_24755 [Pirellula sp.]|nr:hypothetical protein [Pirellula sp.]